MPGSSRWMLAVLLLAPPLAAQGLTGTLVVAHGAGPEWNAQVEAVVAQVETDGPVAVAYLMGPAAASHRFQDQVADLVTRGAARIVVVPLLVSSHSGHYEQLRWLVGTTDSLDAVMRHHLDLSGTTRPAVAVPLVLSPALDDAPELTVVLGDRARALGADGRRPVFLVGHGPNGAEDHAAWMAALRTHSARLTAALGVDVRAGVVRDDAPDAVRTEAVRGVRDLIALQAQAAGAPVLVLPVAIARGRLTEQSLPGDLAGLASVYTGDALLPHPAIARWIERMSRTEPAATH